MKVVLGMEYYVYIVECSDATLYTGIARDVAKRIEEHNGEGKPGAKYTRGRRPVRLCYEECLPSRSAALVRESGIKKLSRAGKQSLIRSQ